MEDEADEVVSVEDSTSEVAVSGKQNSLVLVSPEAPAKVIIIHDAEPVETLLDGTLDE